MDARMARAQDALERPTYSAHTEIGVSGEIPASSYPR
jgi:hypothetical protein